MTTTTLSCADVQPLLMPHRRSWQPVDRLTRPGSYTQGALALSYPLTTTLETSPRPSSLVVVPHGARGGGGDAESWAATLVQAVIEVIASDRPLTQLVRWTSREVYADISRRQQMVARHRSATSPRSSRQHVATVRVCQPTPAAVEIAARITFGSRSRAIAARLDQVGDRWMCTAIRFG